MATIRSREYTAAPNAPVTGTGICTKTTRSSYSITAAASSNGDVYILGGPYQVDAKLLHIIAPNGTPALTSATDNDIGFFKKDENGDFVAIDADVVVDGGDLSSAITDGGVDLIRNLNAAYDTTQTIGDLISITNEVQPNGGIYLGLTTNTATTAVGPVILDLDVVIAPATNV